MLDFSNIEKYRENNRIEAKKAIGGLPHSIWETYSAFANTLGGIILLGVIETSDKSFQTVKLPCPEMLIEDFLELLGDPLKVSINILSEKDVTIEQIDGHSIVAIRVPKAKRSDRPVYIDGDALGGTYLRNGEGDHKCTPDEVRALMRDAALARLELNRNDPRRAEQKRIVSGAVRYLTRNVSATSKELSAHLGISVYRTRALLAKMIEVGIVIPQGAGRSRRYMLKA